MAVYDYRPVWAGALCDPAAAGGSVDRIDLYGGPERTGTPLATAGPATRLRESVYRFEIPDSLPDGRYWCTVTLTPAKNQLTATDRTVRLDLPRGGDLIASAEQVADALNIPLPLTAVQRERYWQKIREAQADVLAYIGRPLTPTPRQLLSATPMFGYALDDPQAWPIQQYDDVVSVVSHISNADGTYEVQLLVGLDGSTEEPIVRYVVAHAAESLRNDPSDTDGTRRVSSVSAEGQSISYDTAPTPGQPGSLPTIDSLSGYKRLVYRPLTTAPTVPWPYGGGRRYRRW
ncbi:hypothetical protein ACIQ9R_36460 [Streptomyces sp. NPDC094447]|uniref:hypothetical protein n=1 Tax=Streptomyces sp. NPDC094447 TaxID=3366062 RepID=UPI00380B66E1